jgi:hypothetical protein
MKGLTLALVMLVAALTLTGILATSLQHRAEENQTAPDDYSPASNATVDTSGWPIEERKDGPANDAGTERSRSRLPPGPADSGA